eukprot:TRINITY_DN1987_c0_g2_i1.p3 TRINITY_DN1987_c0_g2~~TRINITY_DN1987_c0_g2_i1.p3  ORF type:complete len:247 (+),score=18.89 TRINITY_DN1987_c0_g2_i1:687-1427(+)
MLFFAQTEQSALKQSGMLSSITHEQHALISQPQLDSKSHLVHPSTTYQDYPQHVPYPLVQVAQGSVSVYTRVDGSRGVLQSYVVYESEGVEGQGGNGLSYVLYEYEDIEVSQVEVLSYVVYVIQFVGGKGGDILSQVVYAQQSQYSRVGGTGGDVLSQGSYVEQSEYEDVEYIEFFKFSQLYAQASQQTGVGGIGDGSLSYVGVGTNQISSYQGVNNAGSSLLTFFTGAGTLVSYGMGGDAGNNGG